MEKGVAEARVADYGEDSSGMESDSDNGVDLGPVPSEDLDDNEDHDSAICAMEAVLRKARRKALKYKPKEGLGAKKYPKKQAKPSIEQAEVQQTKTKKQKKRKTCSKQEMDK